MVYWVCFETVKAYECEQTKNHLTVYLTVFG